MDFIKVESSNIQKIRYTAETQKLEIVFNGGGHYRYDDFPEPLFEEFLTSPSKGKFFYSHVKGKFNFEKVPQEKESNLETQERIDS